MEVRPGYKQTEVGVIPEDWDAKTLGELGEALIGLTYKPEDVRESGTLVLRSSNVQNDALAFDDNVFVEADIPERIKVRPGDVLICVRNGSRDLIGKSVLLDERTTGMTFGAFMAVYRSPIGNLASFLLQSHILKRQINEHLGATINQITNKSLNSFRIPVPPSEAEQRAIATALSDVDALLGGLDRLIAKKRDLKQAATQQLLTGKTRLPGMHGEWVAASLNGIVTKTAGFWGQEKPDARHPRSVKVIRAGDISPHGSLVATAPRFVSESEFAKAQCKLGDVVITGSGSVGKVWWCDGRSDVAASNFVRVLRPISQRVDGRYLFQLLLSEASQRLMVEHIVTGVMANLGSSFFTTEWFDLPPVSEQTAIADVLFDMDTELAALEQRRDKTRDLKQAMIQELLPGKTRLVPRGAVHA